MCSVMLAWSSPHCFEAVGGYPRQVESTLISSGWIPTMVELTLLLKQWVCSPPDQVEPFVLTLAVTDAQSWFLRPGVCIAVCVVEPTLF